MSTPKLTYAFNEKNELVHVDSVPNGNQCGCVCPYCKKPLWAKHDGKIMQHHFAHANDEACNVSHESVLHQMAKEIIAEQKMVMSPEYHLEKFANLYEHPFENDEEYLWYEDFEDCETDDERNAFDPYWRLRFLSAQLLKFSKVAVEERDKENGIQADCIGTTDDGIQYLIEIYVTHKVDDVKLEKIRNGNMNCLEITIPRKFPLDKKSLTDYLVNRTEGRTWIYYPYAEDLIPKQVEQAQREAIIRQRQESNVKEIPLYKCENCKMCLRQFDSEYEEFLNYYNGKLLDWAYDVFSLKPEDVVANNLRIKTNRNRDSFVTLSNKACFIYGDKDKKKSNKTYDFFCKLYDKCEEIVEGAEDHKNCRYFIKQLEYQRKWYVFCALNHKEEAL